MNVKEEKILKWLEFRGEKFGWRQGRFKVIGEFLNELFLINDGCLEEVQRQSYTGKTSNKVMEIELKMGEENGIFEFRKEIELSKIGVNGPHNTSSIEFDMCKEFVQFGRIRIV